MTAQAYEFRRYALSRLRHPQCRPCGGRAAVIVACRGLDQGLGENLRSLFQQDYDDYSLILVVDHADDPACRPIQQLCQAYPQRGARLIVAGPAQTCGQKVHNLTAATAAVPDDVEYLAFVDSDTRTGRSWLRHLVQKPRRPGRGGGDRLSLARAGTPLAAEPAAALARRGRGDSDRAVAPSLRLGRVVGDSPRKRSSAFRWPWPGAARSAMTWSRRKS